MTQLELLLNRRKMKVQTEKLFYIENEDGDEITLVKQEAKELYEELKKEFDPSFQKIAKKNKKHTSNYPETLWPWKEVTPEQYYTNSGNDDSPSKKAMDEAEQIEKFFDEL